ncbi:MAG TPA: glycosyltransferase [Candidatus Dormibacteraeota bacterium]|nr:glycosyltransferase [Candidatus Dormibacteraeota bacterium]
MNILQVSASDGGGGAHKIALALQMGLRERGHGSWMAVGRRTVENPNLYQIPSGIAPGPTRAVYEAAALALTPLVGRVRGARRARLALRSAHPLEYARARWSGREYFDYPGSRRILEIPPARPDVVHLHNLHTEYFDLRSLADLSSTVPVALTLHDEWTYTGHCAYGIECERWRVGCGACPDLTIYPSVRRDATHENWLAKRAIYEQSRLYVSAPSSWLLDRARESVLATAAADWRLIPNGVDLRVFRPAEKAHARELLGLPQQPLILLFAANRARANRFKDYATIAAATDLVAAGLRNRNLLLIALGGEGPPQFLANGELRAMPWEHEPARVAAFYQAADVYLHAANADTFPTTVLEALATGTPVVATAVGGIDEQVRSLAGAPGAWSGAAFDADVATGVLVPPHDAAGMAAATIALLANDALRAQLGANAVRDAATRFGLAGQLDATLAWYADITRDWRAWRATSS